MRARSVGALSAVYEVVDPKSFGIMRGTSTIIELRGVPYLLTAAHVPLSFDAASFGGYRSRNGAEPFPLPNKVFMIRPPVDVALIPLQPELVATSEVSPLRIEDLAAATPRLGGDALFIHGLPGERSRFSTFGPGLVSETFPYVTVEGTSQYSWFDERLHFAVEYPGEGNEDEFGRSVRVPDPHGLSGAAVWKTNRKERGEAWTPADAQVVGLIHNWDPTAQSLVGTRIEWIREFMLRVLRERDAHARWEARGSPVGDDWTDWFCAVDAFPNLG